MSTHTYIKNYGYKPSPEYKAIAEFYGDRKAERSQVPLINHIDQGIAIIRSLNRILPDGRQFNLYGAVHGYCLHPLFQADAELRTVGRDWAVDDSHDPFPIMLATEYRNQANAWLSDKVSTGPEEGDPIVMRGLPSAGPLPEVAAMLIADKVQNYKDFLTYHKDVHPRSKELDAYFRVWLFGLGIDHDRFLALRGIAKRAEDDAN